MTGYVTTQLATRTRNEQANCIGEDPRTFDYPEHYQDALDICKPCKARAWCLQLVDPANNWTDGVVGGHIWSDGRPVIGPDTKPDAVLLTYIRTNAATTQPVHPADLKHKREPDQYAIDGFIAGDVNWKQLTVEERRMAAALMHRKGVPSNEIQARTRLNGPNMKIALAMNNQPPTK